METIIIKEITKKPAKGGHLMILKLNGNREATVAPFETQEQSFLEFDVGEGGSFTGDIVVDGQYTNIKNIDFNSAQKNPSHEAREGVEVAKQLVSTAKFDYPKDDKIVAQVILKCATEIVAHDKVERETCEDVGRVICNLVDELTGAYKLALENLKAL